MSAADLVALERTGLRAAADVQRALGASDAQVLLLLLLAEVDQETGRVEAFPGIVAVSEAGTKLGLDSPSFHDALAELEQAGTVEVRSDAVTLSADLVPRRPNEASP